MGKQIFFEQSSALKEVSNNYGTCTLDCSAGISPAGCRVAVHYKHYTFTKSRTSV